MAGIVKGPVAVKSGQQDNNQSRGDPKRKKSFLSAFSAGILLVVLIVVFVLVFLIVVLSFVLFFVVRFAAARRFLFPLLLTGEISISGDDADGLPYQFLNCFIYLILDACIFLDLCAWLVEFQFLPLLLVIIIKFHFHTPLHIVGLRLEVSGNRVRKRRWPSENFIFLAARISIP